LENKPPNKLGLKRIFFFFYYYSGKLYNSVGHPAENGVKLTSKTDCSEIHAINEKCIAFHRAFQTQTSKASEDLHGDLQEATTKGSNSGHHSVNKKETNANNFICLNLHGQLELNYEIDLHSQAL